MSTSQVSGPALRRVGAIYYRVICFCFIGCLFFVSAALNHWGAQEIREEWGADFFVTILGAIWLFVSLAIFSWFGLSVYDDVIGGRNIAAVAAICGGLAAMTFIYVGGSSGEGPTYAENAFSAGLGAVALLGLWLALELGTRVSVSVTEERDLASGLRLGGFLSAVGLIFGRALAGDWHSVAGTVHDFWRDGWVALLVLALAMFAEWFLRPTMVRPFPPWWRAGLIPASSYLGLAAGWVWHLGAWEGMPR